MNSSPQLPKACMFTPTANGGHADYSRELLSAMVKHEKGGACVELVSGEDLAATYREAAYPVNAILPALAHRRDFSSKAAWAWSRLLHYPRREMAFLRWLKQRPDIGIVHIQEQRPWLAVPFFKRIKRMGKRLFYTVHNVRPNTYPPLVPRALIRHWNRQACLLCDGLFVHTQGLRDQLAERLSHAHPPIYVTPHGIWTITPDEERIVSGDLGPRLAAKRLLFFGVLRRNKGLHLLLDAMEQLPQFGLTIAGEAREPEYVAAEIMPRIARLRAMGRQIDFRNDFIARGDVPALFARHSALVLPYTRDFNAQSGVVFSALAYNTPVIASESGGLRELFDACMIGDCFGDITPAGVAQSIRRFFERAEVSSLAGQLALARSRFSWSVAAERTLAGYAASFAAHSHAIMPISSHLVSV